jgi:hypothetical protein
VSLASYEEDMLAIGVLPDYFAAAIMATINVGREETLKILLHFLDSSSPRFCSQGRRTLSHALGRVENIRNESFAGLSRIEVAGLTRLIEGTGCCAAW